MKKQLKLILFLLTVLIVPALCQASSIILTITSPNHTITSGSDEKVYGTSESNQIILESGAKADLINFPGQNNIQIQSDSNLFTVSRSGTIVTFQGSDGTVLKIPATSDIQTISFNGEKNRVFHIHDNQIMLDDQVIAESIINLPPAEDIQLDKYSVSVRTGDTDIINITSNGGFYTATTTDSQVATVGVDDDKITITGVSAGNATVVIKNVYGNTMIVSVMVVKDFPALGTLGTWDWDLASGEACYFNENNAWCSGALHSYVEIFWSYQSSSKAAFQTFTNQLCQTVFHDADRTVNSGYVYDLGYFNTTGNFHAGIDIDASVNDLVYSPIHGEVLKSLTDQGQNNRLLIKEKNSSRIWILAHMTPLDKWDEGVAIKEGEKLGNIHSYSCNLDQPGDCAHLHIEVTESLDDWTSGTEKKILAKTISPMQAYYEYLFGSSSSQCGAYVAPGVWKQFDCYNLAAIGKTTNDDPFTPSWRLIGGYWQWGRKGPDPSVWHTTNTEHFAHGPTGPGENEANDGSISSWDDDYASDGWWSDSYKAANDPCPDGFRVPTRTQWQGVLDNNTQSMVGTWSSFPGEPTNYNAARFLGSDLMLPTAGLHYYYSGQLGNRGYTSSYWSSSAYFSSYAWFLLSGSSHAFMSNDSHTSLRGFGYSVRCIAE